MYGRLNLFYKNITSEAIGEEKGVSPSKLKDTAEFVEPLILKTNQDRNDGIPAFRDLPYIQSNLERIKNNADFITKNCRDFTVLGIGDTAAGCEAVYKAIKNGCNEQVPIRIFQDFDVNKIDDLFKDIVSPKSAFQIIYSEENAQQKQHIELLKDKLIQKLGQDCFDSQVFITAQNTHFDLLNDSGLLCSAVCGADLDTLLSGARAMDVKTGTEDLFRNPAAMLAAAVFLYAKSEAVSLILPCCEKFTSFINWQNLLADEMLAQKLNFRQIETIDDAQSNKQLITLIKSQDCAAKEIEEIESQLKIAKIPSVTIQIDEVSPYNLGQLIYLYQVAVLITAKMYEPPENIETEKIIRLKHTGLEAENFNWTI